MNTELYRLVFNPHRGMYIPSAENLPAGHGQGRRVRKSGRQARLKALPLAIALAVSLALANAPAAQANPIGAQVIHGQASFSQTGPVLDIHNSANAILNWQQFSIHPGETTRFIQPDAKSAVLNRVIGPDPSQILGTLSSNGRVFLVNPAGILVGEGARIDVAGLVASTLPMTDADFLAGRLKFGDGLLGGTLDQRGRITTPEGGQVLLVGRTVRNAGPIHSPGGEVLLAAGETVDVLDSATPNVRVRISGVDGQLTNLGEIVADAGRIGLSGALVRNSGTLNASSAVNEGGRIFLRATQRIDLDETSRIAADGTRGGKLSIRTEDADGRLAGQLIVRGELSAQGNGAPGTGGHIETSAARFDVRNVRVHTAGGEWLLDPYDITIKDDDEGNIASVGGTFTSTGESAILDPSSIEAALNAGTSVTVTTGGAGGTQLGNITITDPIIKSEDGNATLTFNAHNDIYLNANITSTSGALNLVFNPDSDNTGGGKLIIDTVTLGLNGGTLTTNKDTSIANSNLTINNAGSWTSTGTVQLYSSTLTVTNSSDLVFSGTLEINGNTASGGGSIDITHSAKLTNSASGTIKLIYPSTSEPIKSTTANGKFVNQGLIESHPGAIGRIATISADFDNTGTLKIQSGTLETTKLPTGGAQNGIIEVAANATYHHSAGGLLNKGTLRGTGTIQAHGDITNAVGGLIGPAGAGTIGTLRLDTTGSTHSHSFINQGTLSFDISGPHQDVLQIDNASDAELGGTVQVSGTGSVATNYNLIQTHATITDTSSKSYSGPYQTSWSVLNAGVSGHNYLRLVLSDPPSPPPPPPPSVAIVANSLGKIYGDPDPVFTYTQSGDPMTLTGALARASGENVGEYSINLGSLACSSPCNLAFTPGLLTISPATLTYLADLVSREQYDPMAPLTGKVTGFKGNDTLENSTSGSLTFVTEATRESPPGHYAVLGSGLTPNNGNYVLQQAGRNATALTVTPPVHFTWIGETGGAWSNAEKWNKARAPFTNSVVRLPVAGIDVRFDVAEATIRSLDSSSAFTLAGGILNVTDSASFARLAMQAGTLNAGRVSVSQSFQGGSGFMNVGETADITQTQGDLVLGNIRADRLRVAAPSGAIRQFGPLSAIRLDAAANGNVDLSEPDNRFGVLRAQSASGAVTLGNTTPGGVDWTEIEAIEAEQSVHVLNTGGMRLGEGRSVSSRRGDIALATRSPLSIFGNLYSNLGSVYLTAGNNGVLTIGSSAFVLAGSGTVVLTGGTISNQGTFSNGQGRIFPHLITGGASDSILNANLRSDLYETPSLLSAPGTLEPHPPILPVLTEPLPSLLDDDPEVQRFILKELDASARLDEEEKRKKAEGASTATTDENKDETRKPELCIC